MQFADHIKEHGIPNSAIHAARYLREAGLDAEEARARVSLLTNKSSTVDDKYIVHVYKYLVDHGLTNDGAVDLGLAEKKAIVFCDSNPWIFATPDEQPSSGGPVKLDAVGQPKRRKGAKKEEAIKFWNANKDQKWSRKEWIEKLMEAVGLSSGGASTYLANLKNGTYK